MASPRARRTVRGIARRRRERSLRGTPSVPPRGARPPPPPASGPRRRRGPAPRGRGRPGSRWLAWAGVLGGLLLVVAAAVPSPAGARAPAGGRGPPFGQGHAP